MITQPCIDVKDKSCVDVCPVSCIYFESDGLERKLQNASSFKDTAHVLRMTRAGVAWEAVGCGMGAYEHALGYAKQRQQFGSPIGQFQLVQDLLVQMLGNITASQCLVLRLSQMQDAGTMREEHASLAKAFSGHLHAGRDAGGFVFLVAKALDKARDNGLPLHPGAERCWRELAYQIGRSPGPSSGTPDAPKH